MGALASFLVYKCVRRVCSPSLEMELSNGPLPYIIFGYAVGLIMITYNNLINGIYKENSIYVRHALPSRATEPNALFENRVALVSS